MRSLLQRCALILGAVVGLLGTRPATANAQKALVYCPVSLDTTGCSAIVTALTGPTYPLGVDRGYDGTDGTVDLKAVDLFSYSVFVVPSLADDSTSQPYAKLRDPEVAEHLKAALIGRLALWSGTPDQGATNRVLKDALIQNLAAWAGGAFATARGPGLVALLDASAGATVRYDWVRAITPVPVTSDPNLLIYSSVRSLDANATTILTSGSGTIAYTNMATFGFQVPNGAAGVSLDAVGQTGTSQGGQVVLLTMEAGNTSGATVKTDKDDYAPGTTVVITGTGWAPNESVKLTLHHDPLRDSDTELTATADGAGNFTNTEFAPGEYDVDVRFVLTAIGQASGRRAQTTFTDGQPQSIDLTPSSVTVAPGTSAAYTASVTMGGNANACTITLEITTPLPTGVTGSFNNNPVVLPNGSGGNNFSRTLTLTTTNSGPPAGRTPPGTYPFTTRATRGTGCQGTAGTGPTDVDTLVVSAPTTTSPSNATATYGDASVTLNATVSSTSTVGTGTVTFTVKQGPTTIGSATTSGPVSGGNASVTYALPAGTAAGTYTIEAVYNAGAGFTGSNGTATLTINTRAVTVTADAKAKVYGAIDPALTYQITSGSLAAGDAFSGSLARAAGENVGVYAIQKGTLALSANYVLTYVGASLTISTRPVTVTADPKTKVYGDADPALTYQITSGSLAFADAFSGALTRVPGNNVGAFAIQQGTLALNANYVLTYVGANLTITGRPITVTADAKSKAYGDADPALTYQITLGSLATGDAITGALSRVAGENVGTYAIQQGTLTAGTNYALTFIGANLSITTRAVTVTADPQTKVYGNADPAPLTYQATSGSLVSGDSFSGALTRVAGETVGTYAITQGTLSAGTNYALTFVGANLTITTRAVTVTADPKTKVYGNADPALTYAITSGTLAFSDAFSGALTRAAGENVGTHAITQGTLALNSNYVLSFVGADLTITVRPIAVTADAKTKVYGEADPAFTYQITSGSLAFSDAFSGALSRVAGENVGTYAIGQGTLALNANYNLSFVGANLSITQRPITVTADPKTKVYGDADPALTYQLTAGTLVSGDGLTGSLTRVAGEAVGTYAIQQGSVTAGPNYLITFVPANFTITQRPITVTADAKSKIYGEADPAFTYQVTTGNLVFGDTFSGSLARVAGENVGTYAINKGTLSAGANYDLTFVGANLTINVRPVTVTADAKTKVYGVADPALTYQITSGSLAFTDAFSGALSRASGETVGSYAIQQGTLTLSANYALTYVGANLTITPRPITVTADPKTKVYGDADPQLTYQITSGSLAFEDPFTGNISRDPGENVGSYAITQGTLALSTNYTLTFVPSTLTITRRQITVTANPQTKVYGNADPTFTYLITSGNLVGSDALTGTLSRASGEDVGTYAITQGGLTAGGNYDLTFAGALLTITKRAVTVTAHANTKTYGDSDPTLTYGITSGSLAFSDAFSGALTREAGENVGTYAIQQGTLTLGGNYDLSFAGANFTITKRAVAITADAKTKTYGDADPALTYHISSGSLAFSDAFTGSLTRVAGENVGSYAIQQNTVALNPINYDLAYIGANLTIDPRAVTVTADPQTKVYGESDPALTYQLTSGNLVGSDAFSGALTRTAGENVGSHAINQGTLALSTNYTLTYVGANLTITQRPISVAADPKTKVYGNADPALTYAITSGSLAFSDAFGGALTRAAGENVGTYAITQGTLALSSNYVLSFVGADLTITVRPITVTADAKTKVYGNADPAFTYQITSGSLAFSDAFSGTLSRLAGENVGTYAIGQGTLALNSNYNLSFLGANLSITARPVTITADPKTKTYGDSDPALTYQITSGSLAFSDAFSGTLARATGENVGMYAINQGTVALNSNYALSYIGANLTISKRTLNVTADDKSKIAGAVNPTFTGSVSGVQFLDNITATYSTTATTLSTPGNYPIVPAIVDPNGKIGNYDVHLYNGTLTVTPNAKPVLGAFTGPLLPTALGTSINISIPFTDADVAASQPYTATIDWGNGTNSTSAFATPGTITGTKNYPAAGVYNVTVTVKQDNFPTTHYDTKTYEYYVVVYDPNGGFVTGGGWIDSPATACKRAPCTPQTVGKANFGFVSKYKKGQSMPDGNTEFQFKAGDINFHSEDYEWLVVAGAKAQFKGTGTINGSGNYGFMITAIDGQISGGGGVDKFRIKIWDKNNGDAVVYDNQVTGDSSDTATPNTTLGGGSINIQAK